ncbi:MAG TPA: hypothetical protein VGH23_20440 [Rhizomicrobium sp.]|jgi:hypothetical protein
MAKSSPEKLAQALRANLKRRKGPVAQSGPEEARAAQRAPESSPAQAPAQSAKTSV